MSTLLFVMWLIVNLLSFGRCVHQPIFRPMRCPRCCFVMSVIVNLLLALMRVHQPVSRPMSTLLFCYVGVYQFVVFWSVCPSALFPSDVHVAVCYVVDCQFVACLGACPSARFLSDVHAARLCDNRVVYGLLRIEHTTHAIQPSGEITSLKPSVQLS